MDYIAPGGRFAEIKKIRKQRVVKVIRKMGVRVWFKVESISLGQEFLDVVALDLITSTDLEKDLFLFEIRLFASIDHPLVLDFYDSFVDIENGLLW